MSCTRDTWDWGHLHVWNPLWWRTTSWSFTVDHFIDPCGTQLYRSLLVTCVRWWPNHDTTWHLSRVSYLLSSTVSENIDSARKQKSGYWRPASLRTSTLSRRLRYVNSPAIVPNDMLTRSTNKCFQNLQHITGAVKAQNSGLDQSRRRLRRHSS